MSSSEQRTESPFEPFTRLFQRRAVSDDEFVEKLRKSLRWWDRWRWAGVALHGAIIATVLWLAFQFVKLLQGMQALFPQQNPMPDEVFLICVVLGAKLGLLLHGSAWALMNNLVGMRSERLLVKCYDAMNPKAVEGDHTIPASDLANSQEPYTGANDGNNWQRDYVEEPADPNFCGTRVS
jgi:hypothetical protein